MSNKFKAISALPTGSSVGTSSLRRQAQIVERHPGLQVKLLRGNVDTRLAKLDRGEYDAIVLAAAGLTRLGLDARIASYLEADEMLPAPGQGALGIECMAARTDLIALLAPLIDIATSTCVRAERTVSRALGGSCTIPLGAYAQRTHGNMVRLRALVASPDGKRVVRSVLEASAADPETLGNRVADDLRRQGAAEILGL